MQQWQISTKENHIPDWCRWQTRTDNLKFTYNYSQVWLDSTFERLIGCQICNANKCSQYYYVAGQLELPDVQEQEIINAAERQNYNHYTRLLNIDAFYGDYIKEGPGELAKPKIHKTYILNVDVLQT